MGRRAKVLGALVAGWAAGLLACRAPEPLPVLAVLPEFSLIERSGSALDRAFLAGRPIVVDFVYTRCPTSCPRLTARMKELEKRLPAGSTARLLSISVDPDYDRPEVLRRYAESWRVGERWLLVTGERTEIRELIRNGFLLPVEEIPQDAASPILHSNRFALIDGQGRLRATYDALEEGALERILADLQQIERGT